MQEKQEKQGNTIHILDNDGDIEVLMMMTLTKEIIQQLPAYRHANLPASSNIEAETLKKASIMSERKAKVLKLLEKKSNIES